jgi:hypothetical protein
MNSFEAHLMNGIPQAEAAAYFLRIRGRDKLAVDAATFEAAIADLPEGEREELLKSASVLAEHAPVPGRLKKANMMAPAAQTPLPATGRGMNMSPAAPAPLPPTAMGQQPMKMAASDKSPEETGKERAHASLSAEFEKEKHHSHESNRNLIGHIGGAALGAAVGHKMKGNATSKVLATLAGSHLGGQVGKKSGQEADREDWEKKHAAFKLALEQTGMGEPKPANRAQLPESEPSELAQQIAPSGPMEPEGGGVTARVPPAVQAWLEAQQAGDQAAEMGHAEFLRTKLEEARAAQQAAEEQAQSLEAQQAAHDAQQAQIQQQVQESIQQASQAQDQVLQEQQAAAAMRIAYQQLRGQVLQIASTDPPALSSDAAALSAASTQAGPSSGPGGEANAPERGPAGQAPNPGTPNTPAPLGDETVSDQIKPNEPTFSNAEPSSQASTKEQQTAGVPNKEVLSHYRPLDLRRLLPSLTTSEK